ncbi:protein FAR1-RELATED SEQUENCE 5-like [Quercus lobata]|uniref:protein FAR1-RELATED SEQUENCE 5-like n=1 Tax=Quercus lobata TaxID=97700 RepID=UPI0012490FE0|nr:protein FAR1-RELATED SEQUENCE 5-like [Quercus lobata]
MTARLSPLGRSVQDEHSDISRNLIGAIFVAAMTRAVFCAVLDYSTTAAAVICNSSDIEGIEDCLFVERLENSDENLLYKVTYIENEAYNLYNNYALQTGFSIRKGKPRYFNGIKNIRQHEFLCSKEGFKVDEDPCEEKNWKKLETRTGCKAFIHFTVENEAWRVTAFNPDHNHELALPSERHLLRSSCHISKPKAGLIDSMVNAGISTKNTYLYLTEKVGGSENVGFTEKDCYNHVNTKKMSTISVGAAQSLLNHFKKRQIEDPMFFYTVQVLITIGRMYYLGVHFFWMKLTTASFKWLFKSFLDSMGNRSPITIFADQDQAMSNAIEEVFSNTHHRLCLWHISKNATSYFGELNSNSEFQSLWNKCQKYCDSELEFQNKWDKMMHKFNLEDHHWLNMMYKIRHKWSIAFTKDSFTVEFKPSSRSESTNHVLNNIADTTISLTNFVIKYESVLADMRSSEFNEDFRCKQGAPQRAVKKSGILGHAAQVYTCKIFRLFEYEFLNSLVIEWKQVDCQYTIDVFEVKEEDSERVRIVHFDHFNSNISCSCKKFESLGILCCHALRVFNLKNLTKIPSQYILKRWTKEAKKGMMAYEQDNHSSGNAKEAEIVWRNSMLRIANTIISKSQGDDSLKSICQKILLGLDEKIERESSKLGSNANLEKNEVVEHNIVDEMLGLSSHVSVLNPPCVRSNLKKPFLQKEWKKKDEEALYNYLRKDRLKGHFEKRKAKSSKDASSSRKAKKQVSKENPNVSFGGSYNPAIYQPPNPYSHLGFTSDNAHGQSYMSWTNHSQEMSCVNVPFTTVLQGTNVITQLSQNPMTYIPSQINSLMYGSKQSNSTHIQEVGRPKMSCSQES